MKNNLLIMKQNQICEIYLYHNIFYKSVIIKHIIQVVFFIEKILLKEIYNIINILNYTNLIKNLIFNQNLLS